MDHRVTYTSDRSTSIHTIFKGTSCNNLEMDEQEQGTSHKQHKEDPELSRIPTWLKSSIPDIFKSVGPLLRLPLTTTDLVAPSVGALILWDHTQEAPKEITVDLIWPNARVTRLAFPAVFKIDSLNDSAPQTDKAQSSDKQPVEWTGDAKPTLFRNKKKLVPSSQPQPQVDRGNLEQPELHRREFEQPEIDSGGSRELINDNIENLPADVREDQSADCRTQVNQAPEEGSSAPILQRNVESNANEAFCLVHDWSEVPFARLQDAQGLLESEGTQDMVVEAPLQNSGSISVKRLRAVARSTDRAQVMDQVLLQVRPSDTDLLAEEQPTKKRKQLESAAEPSTAA
ncbi:hypothetical protein R1sor_010661 [Riccia sorocarpa]|uniref:Uncharacterized protein n=1 Tax=Riccia sorocarpa TaxID=122646 RepID=A0ABD3HYP1_9MARC